MNKVIENIEKYSLLAIVFLVPVAFVTIFPNFFDTPKIIILAFGVMFVLLVKAIKTIVNGKLNLSLSGFDFPLLLIAGAYIASAILRTPNKMEAFFLPGNATIIVGLVLLYFLINSAFTSKKAQLAIITILSGVIVAVFSLASFSGIFAQIPQLPEVMRQVDFSLVGMKFLEAIFLATLIPLGISLVISEADAVKKTFWGVSVAVITLGAVISTFQILPGKELSPQMPTTAVSWSIAVDTLKASPLLGVGPGNYLTSFNLFRPVEYNFTDIWPLRFNSASSFFLTLLAEVGLIGLAGFALLLFVAYKSFRAEQPQINKGLSSISIGAMVSLALALVFLLIFPTNVSLLLLTLVLLSLVAKTKELNLPLAAYTPSATGGFYSKAPAFMLTLPVIILVLVFAIFAPRAVRAEYRFKNSLDAVVEADGETAYEEIQQAIILNPYVDRYRATFAQINLAIASGIAEIDEAEITDEDRETISLLIQQAIEEAKAAVALNPQRAGNWELLGGIYMSIMAFAEGADQFALESISQAIALDPISPDLRISLGGIYYSLGLYDEAIRVFDLAAAAKPDFANAYYNLAIALRESGDIERAIEQMRAVLNLVERDSPDYELARAELDALEARRPVGELEEEGETLTPPQVPGEPIISPPLTLPEGAEPPEAPENDE